MTKNIKKIKFTDYENLHFFMSIVASVYLNEVFKKKNLEYSLLKYNKKTFRKLIIKYDLTVDELIDILLDNPFKTNKTTLKNDIKNKIRKYIKKHIYSDIK